MIRACKNVPYINTSNSVAHDNCKTEHHWAIHAANRGKMKHT